MEKHRGASQATDIALNRVWVSYRALDPRTRADEAFYDEAVRSLHNATELRRTRLLNSRAELPIRSSASRTRSPRETGSRALDANGTHQGEFRGFPPKTHGVRATGNQVHFTATDIYRIVDGLVAEEWNTLEQLDVMQQIGAFPEAPG